MTCGSGTTDVNGMCEASGSNATTCGTGTHLDGTTCVPDSPAATGAPTVATIDPPASGVSGFVLFTITGTGFAGADVSSLHVFFGDTTNANCEAQVGAATATTIAGEVPPACNLNVNVTVTTNLGSATIPFHYEALFAADGDGGAATGTGGDLYVIDPFAQVSYDVGALTDTGATKSYGLSGLAFTSTGTLYGVTTGDSPVDTTSSRLVTVDPTTAVVTEIGPTVDAAAHKWFLTDLKVSGTTLYGWGYFTVSNVTKQGLVTVNTTTGVVTALGTPAAVTFGWGALAIDSAGNLFAAANGAGADILMSATGELDSVNTTTGALTSAATLDYPIGAPINAMTLIGTKMVGAIDNGTYGANMLQSIYGNSLAVIDPAATTKVAPVFELPAQLGAQSHIDALDMAPPALTLARPLERARWTQLGPATPVTPAGH